MQTDDETDHSDSRSTIGLSPAGQRAMKVLMDKKWFANNYAAFKAAVAYAVANDLSPTVGASYKTEWNVGTLDKSGEFRVIVGDLLDTRNPLAVVQGLGDAGLRALEDRAAVADVPTEALLPD